MKKDIRIFVFAIVLPVLLGTVATVSAIRTARQKILDDERRDLKAHAELLADALMSRVLSANHPGPQMRDNPNVSRHPPPPRHMKERNRSKLTPEDITPFCAELCKTRRFPDTAFEIRNLDGGRFFATDNWPLRHGLTGECDLAPPLGDKTLFVARADGGADLRFRIGLMFAIAGTGSIFLALTLLIGGMMFIRTIRRERRDARAKADFFDNVSHELKTPLAGIRLNAELLAQGRIPDEELRRGALEAIIVESDRLGKMVDELLNFSRLERGTRRYSLETFDLALFALEPAELQGVAGASQGMAKVKSVGPGVLVVADKDAVRQIGIILVSNALKYAEGEIDLEVERNLVRVMDRGPGVPHGDEERIFERFYRGDDSLSSKTSGNGLGLAIARTLARGMGGDLTYSHRPGGGSIFTLKLKEA